MLKKLIPLILVALLMLSLTSCDILTAAIDDPEIREMTEAMLDAVISDDYDTAYSLFPDDITETDFRSGYDQLRSTLAGVNAYELTPTYRNYTSTNTQSSTQLTYYMTTEKGNYVVEATITDGYDGLYYFGITPEEQTTLFSNGTIGNMDNATAFQWIMLAVAALETIFVIIVLVDCCRRKLKLKPLWIILTLVGISFSLSISATNVNFNFNLGSIANYSSLIIYGDGSSSFRLLVPAGAIMYLAFRNKFTIKPEVIEAENVTIEDTEPTEE